MTDLISQMTGLNGIGQSAIWTTFVVFMRVGAVMALLPAFGEQSIPQRVRLVITLAFTAVVAPAVSDKIAPLQGAFYLLLLTEVVAGLALGIGLRLFILALQIAGTIAAQSTSLSQLFGGTGGEPQPAMSHLFVLAGLALAVMSGLHVRAAAIMILSYDVMPAGTILPAPDLSDWGLMQVTNAFSLAFSLASPFVAASVVYNIALGVINRAMPQMMVIFVGAPALTLGGLFLLALSSPLLLAVWKDAFLAFLNSPFTSTP